MLMHAWYAFPCMRMHAEMMDMVPTSSVRGRMLPAAAAAPCLYTHGQRQGG